MYAGRKRRLGPQLRGGRQQRWTLCAVLVEQVLHDDLLEVDGSCFFGPTHSHPKPNTTPDSCWNRVCWTYLALGQRGSVGEDEQGHLALGVELHVGLGLGHASGTSL